MTSAADAAAANGAAAAAAAVWWESVLIALNVLVVVICIVLHALDVEISYACAYARSYSRVCRRPRPPHPRLRAGASVVFVDAVVTEVRDLSDGTLLARHSHHARVRQWLQRFNGDDTHHHRFEHVTRRNLVVCAMREPYQAHSDATITAAADRPCVLTIDLDTGTQRLVTLVGCVNVLGVWETPLDDLVVACPAAGSPLAGRYRLYALPTGIEVFVRGTAPTFNGPAPSPVESAGGLDWRAGDRIEFVRGGYQWARPSVGVRDAHRHFERHHRHASPSTSVADPYYEWRRNTRFEKRRRRQDKGDGPTSLARLHHNGRSGSALLVGARPDAPPPRTITVARGADAACVATAIPEHVCALALAAIVAAYCVEPDGAAADTGFACTCLH